MEQQQKRTLTPAEKAAQQAYKASKESFRSRIKEFVEKQVTLKPLLRPGATNEIAPWQAQSKKHVNCYNLRNLHVAYAIFRGKPIPEMYWMWDGKNIVNNGNFPTRKNKAGIIPEPSSPDQELVKKFLKEMVVEAVYPS